MSDPFEILHRWPAERPARAESEGEGVRVPLAARPSLTLSDEGAQSGERFTPFARVTEVRIRYVPIRHRFQIGVHINVASSAGERSLMSFPIIVLDRDRCVTSPGEVRWIAEEVAARASAVVGRPVPVVPPVSNADPPALPVVEAPEVTPDPTALGVRAVADGLSWGTRTPRYGWLLGMLGVPIVLLVALPVFFFLGVFIGAIANSGAAILGVTFGPTAVLVLLWMAPFLWMTFRPKLNRADGTGIHIGGGVIPRTVPWSAAGRLALEGRVPGPVRLSTGSGQVLAQWGRPGWASTPRIVDIVAFSRRLAELGGLPLDLEIPEVTAWRDRAVRKKQKRLAKKVWAELNDRLRFSDLEAAQPVRPDGTVFDADGLSVSVWQVNYLRLGSVSNVSRWGATEIEADARGVGVGDARTPWSSIESVVLEFRTHKRPRSSTVHTQGRLGLVVDRRTRPVGPWVKLRIDGEELLPVGELLWIRDTLRKLHAQYAGRDVAALGDASEIPEALSQIAKKAELTVDRE